MIFGVKMFLVGLTGGAATGKSTSCQIFRDMGVPVIDADKIARDIVEPGQPAYNDIVKAFGPQVLNHETGRLNRDVLRGLILEDSDKRLLLNRITHPRILRRLFFDVVSLLFRGHVYVVLEVPLLFETSSRLVQFLHKIIVVQCEYDFQMQRLMEDRRLTEREAGLLLGAQMDPQKKAEKADFLVDNSTNNRDLRLQVESIHEELSRSTFHWKVRFGLGLALTGLGSLVYVVAIKCFY